ncbi:MAG: 4,5-DOPA dioxygenase extradiol [Ideonella sp.]|nr:4,5-DOPA dioxygenase extradiol [Ideonella sp.]MCC7456619.1 4,5-DOPA dioxygenase extradiol [Nitrospira sp.]
MPVVFVGHGSPMLAIEDSTYRRGWTALASALPPPVAVLCISAHWTTCGTFVTGAEHPDTLHDFTGFPRELYQIAYPASGSSWLASRVRALLGHDEVQLDPERGFDHGAWSVLSAMFARADVPVVQLSLDLSRPADHHRTLARRLAPLRDEGVLVVGSGNVVHNLAQHKRGDAEPRDWGIRFDARIRSFIEQGDHDAVVHYPALGLDAVMSVPTPEHFLPLVYVLGLTRPTDPVRVFNAGLRSAVSMTSYRFGPLAAGSGARHA